MLWTILLPVICLVVSIIFIVIVSVISYKKRGLSKEAELVRKMLPGIDCGMCGENSCKDFAVCVSKGLKEPESCQLIKPKNVEKLREFYKPNYEQSTQMVAIVKCKGGSKAVNSYDYNGAKSCAIQESLHSGCKACKYACLGCGDCVSACKYNAIKINKRGCAEIVRSKCIGCGACISSCPNHLIEMTKMNLTVGVICNNQSDDENINEKCAVGCSHCGLCLDVCPADAVQIINNVPMIDADKCIKCNKCVAVCPNHVISRL